MVRQCWAVGIGREAMRFGRAWSGSSRRLTLLFAGVLLIPALTLVGLGLALLKQDTELSAQRAVVRRQAADRIARALEESLAAAERLLSAGTIPEGAVRITASAAGILTDPPAWWPGGRSAGCSPRRAGGKS